MKLEGVSHIGAAGLQACLGDGRHAAVFVPKQHSSGGKVVMIGIDKHGGDKYNTCVQSSIKAASRGRNL